MAMVSREQLLGANCSCSPNPGAALNATFSRDTNEGTQKGGERTLMTDHTTGSLQKSREDLFPYRALEFLKYVLQERLDMRCRFVHRHFQGVRVSAAIAKVEATLQLSFHVLAND